MARQNMNATIKNNFFNSIRNNVSSITRSNSCIVENGGTINVEISNNQFDNFGYLYYGGIAGSGINTGNGILIRDVQASVIDIIDNDFNILPNSNGNTAIRLEYNGASRPTPNSTNIQGNDINNSRNGISLLNYSDANISSINTINLPAGIPTAGRYFGIRLENSSKTTIVQNVIQRIGSNPSSNYRDDVFGISCESSSVNDIKENNVSRLGSGIRFFNAGINSVNCNDLNSNIVGVRIVNSKIGDQGSINLAQDNWWTNISSTQYNLFGQGPNYYASNWYCQQSSPFLPLFGYIIPTLIPPINSTIWLNTPAGGPNSCNNPVLLNQQREMAKIAGEEGDFNLLDSLEQYRLQREVFITIHLDSSWFSLGTPDDQVLIDFYEEMFTSPMGQLIEVMDLISVDNLQAELNVNSVITGNNADYNEKVMLQIYINYLQNELNLSESELNNAFDIAQQNPIYGGIAVYWARALIQLNFEDFYLDPPSRLIQVRNLTNLTNLCSVYPNPSCNEVFFDSQSSNNNLNLRIFDTCGKLILAKLIPPGINKISFIDYSMAEGLFYYELSTEDMLTQRGKIVVVRK